MVRKWNSDVSPSESGHLDAVPRRDGLLRTKLAVPPVRRPVERRRLLRRLDRVEEGALALLSAPAGFGKTTLMAQWAREAATPVAWLSLDEADDDPVRFLSHLLAALRTAQPELNTHLSLQTVPGSLPAEQRLTPVINSLCGLRELTLCLDDYHRVSNEEVHRAIAFLVENRPPELRMMIASRADPSLPISRLRARGELAELRAADLRFTDDEASHFLNDTMELVVGEEDVRVLRERTEGWIAGLQLAAHAVGPRQGREEVARFARSLAGNSRHVADYLADEVLSGQRDDVRTFLLKTSVLDRLCAPLCEAVTGIGGAQDVLEALERANLFLVPLDDERRWYRYHHLFGEFLAERLERALPDEVPGLHGRAVAWYGRNGQPLTAARHAVSAGDLDRAAELLAAGAGELLDRGEIARLVAWGERLPEDSLRPWPDLGVSLAWADLISGRLERAERRARAVRDALEEPSGPSLRGRVDGVIGRATSVEACAARARGDLTRSAQLSDRALRLLPVEDRTTHSIVAFNLGVVRCLSGELEAARKSLVRARADAFEASSRYLALVATKTLADLEVQSGHVDLALGLYREALRLDEAHPVPAAGVAHAGLAELLYERNDLDGAVSHARRAVELGAVVGSPDATLPARAVLALVERARGEAEDAAREIVESGRPHDYWSRVPHVANQLAVNEAHLLLARGEGAAASELLRQWAPSADHSMVALNEQRRILLARALLAEGRATEAADLLERFVEAAASEGRRGSEARFLTLLALAVREQGDTDAAVEMLRRALPVAEAGGYVRSFVDEGPAMQALLRCALAKGVEPHYASRLLASFAGPNGPSQPMPGVLSKREREVLRLVASGMSNEEVASASFVALSTVKKHLHNAYRKLGVGSRIQAVTRARELGLL